MNEQAYLEQKNKMMGENSFMKKLLKKRLNQKGLTLIELLAVIVILAIVAAIAIPAISNLIANQRDKAILANAQTIIAGAKLASSAGACGDDGSCDDQELADYVDGVALEEGDSVTVDGWVLFWGGLDSDNFSAADARYNPNYVEENGISEEALLNELDS